MINLKALDLSSNVITVLHPNLFLKNTKLEVNRCPNSQHLNLSSNLIDKEFKLRCLVKLKKLKRLDISQNRLYNMNFPKLHKLIKKSCHSLELLLYLQLGQSPESDQNIISEMKTTLKGIQYCDGLDNKLVFKNEENQDEDTNFEDRNIQKWSRSSNNIKKSHSRQPSKDSSYSHLKKLYRRRKSQISKKRDKSFIKINISEIRSTSNNNSKHSDKLQQKRKLRLHRRNKSLINNTNESINKSNYPNLQYKTINLTSQIGNQKSNKKINAWTLRKLELNSKTGNNTTNHIQKIKKHDYADPFNIMGGNEILDNVKMNNVETVDIEKYDEDKGGDEPNNNPFYCKDDDFREQNKSVSAIPFDSPEFCETIDLGYNFDTSVGAEDCKSVEEVKVSDYDSCLEILNNSGNKQERSSSERKVKEDKQSFSINVNKFIVHQEIEIKNTDHRPQVLSKILPLRTVDSIYLTEDYDQLDNSNENVLQENIQPKKSRGISLRNQLLQNLVCSDEDSLKFSSLNQRCSTSREYQKPKKINLRAALESKYSSQRIKNNAFFNSDQDKQKIKDFNSSYVSQKENMNPNISNYYTERTNLDSSFNKSFTNNTFYRKLERARSNFMKDIPLSEINTSMDSVCMLKSSYIVDDKPVIEDSVKPENVNFNFNKTRRQNMFRKATMMNSELSNISKYEENCRENTVDNSKQNQKTGIQVTSVIIDFESKIEKNKINESNIQQEGISSIDKFVKVNPNLVMSVGFEPQIQESIVEFYQIYT